MVELGEATLLHPSERERILRAAAAICAEQGYGGMSVAAISARAGVQEEAFLRIFADAEDCMVAAMNAITSQVLAEVSRVYSPDRSEWESGMRGIRAILELMAAHPNFAYLGYVGARQMAPPRATEVYRTAHGLLAMMIERLWEFSALETQPSPAASAAPGGAEAVVRRELAAERAERLPELLPDFVYAATVPFLGQEEALRLAGQARETLRGSAWGGAG